MSNSDSVILSEHRRLRNRRIAAAFSAGTIARIISVAAPLALVPMLIHYLGPERFGVWATVLSVTSMFVFADLGLGSGLLTRLSRSQAQDDSDEGASLVSNAYVGASIVSLVLLLMGSLLLLVVEPSSLFKVDGTSAAHDANLIVIILVGAFIVSIPLGLIARVQLAVQRSWQSSLWLAVGQLLSIPIVWALIQVEAAPAVVVLGVALAPIIVGLLNTAYFFFTHVGRDLRPRIRLCDQHQMGSLLRVGAAFSLVSIFSNAALNLDNIIVATTLGVDQVTVLTVASRLFRATALLTALVGMPLWAANGEALARGDAAWVKKTVRLSMVGLSSLTALVVGVLVVFRVQIVSLWIGGAVPTPALLYLGLAVWSIVFSIVAPFFMVQNAAGQIRLQMYGWGAYLVTSVPAKYIATSLWGVAALPWAGAVCFAVTVVPSAIVGYLMVMRSIARGDPLPLERNDQPEESTSPG